MTLQQVVNLVSKIRKLSRIDCEGAHSEEDRMHLAVLAEIAANSEDSESRALATTALTSRRIKFPRYCA